MASIITASASSGLTQSADTSGVLQLASGVGNLVTIPSVTGTAMVSGNMPAFSVFNNATQSVTSDTWTKVILNTETFDTANAFDSTTNYRFTPQVAGYYQLNGAVYFEGSASVTRGLVSIYKNGTITKFGGYGPPYLGNNRGIVTVSSLIYLNGSTDYVELYGFVTGTSVQFNGNSAGEQLYFNGTLVRTA